jgi:predicted HTH transcriptional regulator
VFQPDPTQLLARMRRFEDHFTERKTSNDLKDMIKTLVAFGNSTPPNASAVLYLGVRDSGEIETPQPNLDNLQKSFRKDLEKVYPLYCTPPI